MNNKLEVIGIDHGWSMMKTISQVFVTGVKEITTTPALFGDVLEYEGKFYKVGTVRQEVKDTKVEDDSFYLLTLATVAKELKRRGLEEAKVFLAVGLPLTRFGAEKNDFIKYLTKNKRVSFKYENEPYYIEIDDVAVFPQCYAAVVDKIPTMAKKTLIVDIGSWTIDIMPVINKSPDESKCVTIPKGLITCMDNKFIPFNHPMFNQTADGKGEPYVHQIRGADNLIGPPFEILSDKAVKYYEKLKDKGENVYIDSLTYEQFMMLGDAELSRRFSMQDEAEQKAKIDREQANELEYVDESQKSDAAESASATNGNTGTKPARNPEREKPKWEDTITNRMLHWSYTPEQKEEVKKALAAGVPKATILTYFYPEVTVERMSSYRKKQ